MIETTELYGGSIKLEFDSARHQYRVLNKGRRFKVPSVTRITSVVDKSGPLMGWAINNTLEVCKGAIGPGVEYAETYLEAVWSAAKKASSSKKSDAADRGRAVHREIESALKQPTLVQELSGQSNQALAWLRSLGTICAVEQRLYSRQYRYSGTCDGLVQISTGELVLLDWKTGKSIYPEFRLQTAAYVHAWEEEHPDQPIEGRYLVHITPEGDPVPHYYPRSSYRLDFKGFKGALDLWTQLQKISKSL